MIAIVLLGWMLSACQSAGSLTGSDGRYQQRIDDATPRDILSHTQQILVGKYQYELSRSDDSPSSIYIETMWKELNPTEDEQSRGIEEIRTRFTIISREVRSGISNTQLHNLTFQAEVETSTGEEGGWSRETITEERKEYLDRIFYDFETEFRSGVMTF